MCIMKQCTLNIALFTKLNVHRFALCSHLPNFVDQINRTYSVYVPPNIVKGYYTITEGE